MPPDTPLIVEAALAFMGMALIAIITMGWGTRELVQKIHADLTNERSGLSALWEKMDEVLGRLNDLERERHESSRPNPHG